jgi:hypothetical protein
MQQSSACYLLHAGFFFGLFSETEDGSGMFLSNIGFFQRITKVIFHKIQIFVIPLS